MAIFCERKSRFTARPLRNEAAFQINRAIPDRRQDGPLPNLPVATMPPRRVPLAPVPDRKKVARLFPRDLTNRVSERKLFRARILAQHIGCADRPVNPSDSLAFLGVQAAEKRFARLFRLFRTRLDKRSFRA